MLGGSGGSNYRTPVRRRCWGHSCVWGLSPRPLQCRRSRRPFNAGSIAKDQATTPDDSRRVEAGGVSCLSTSRIVLLRGGVRAPRRVKNSDVGSRTRHEPRRPLYDPPPKECGVVCYSTHPDVRRRGDWPREWCCWGGRRVPNPSGCQTLHAARRTSPVTVRCRRPLPLCR